MIALWDLDGPMNGGAFTAYMTCVLVPERFLGNIVITNNLSSDAFVLRLSKGRRPCAPSKSQVPASSSFRPIARL